MASPLGIVCAAAATEPQKVMQTRAKTGRTLFVVFIVMFPCAMDRSITFRIVTGPEAIPQGESLQCIASNDVSARSILTLNNLPSSHIEIVAADLKSIIDEAHHIEIKSSPPCMITN